MIYYIHQGCGVALKLIKSEFDSFCFDSDLSKIDFSYRRIKLFIIKTKSIFKIKKNEIIVMAFLIFIKKPLNFSLLLLELLQYNRRP